MTRGQALLLGLGVLALGGVGYGGFRAAGMEGFSPGVASSTVLVLVVLGWTGSYLFRVVSGQMTYMQQRRRYRASYEARTNEELMARFEALSPEEQANLLAEVGQGGSVETTAQPTAPPTP